MAANSKWRCTFSHG